MLPMGGGGGNDGGGGGWLMVFLVREEGRKPWEVLGANPPATRSEVSLFCTPPAHTNHHTHLLPTQTADVDR